MTPTVRTAPAVERRNVIQQIGDACTVQRLQLNDPAGDVGKSCSERGHQSIVPSKAAETAQRPRDSAELSQTWAELTQTRFT